MPPRRGSHRQLARLAAALWMALACLCPSLARAVCKLPQMTLPVRMVDSRPIATLTINGSPAQLLVDSGAFFSMLSASTASQLNLQTRPLPRGMHVDGYTGRIDARYTRVAKLGLLDKALHNVDFLVGGNELGAGIMGILGRNILSVGDTEYDLAHGEVHLSFPDGDCDDSNLAHWAGAAPVIVTPLETDRRSGDTAIRIAAKVNGTPVTALLDTGAPRTALSLKAARRAGIQEHQLTAVRRVAGGGAGRARSWLGEVDLLEIEGEKLRNNRLRVDEVDHSDFDMLLGLDYFLSHRIYVSRLQGKVYATWNGTPVFDSDRAAVAEASARYAAAPKEVSRDDADALARRGEAAIASGDHARALEDLNRAHELAPGQAQPVYARARLLLAMREPRRALADLDTALQLDPALHDARMRRARLRATLDDRPGAEADLTVLDKELPPSSNLRSDMASLLAGLGQVGESLRQSDLWLGSHPADARVASVLNTRCRLRTRRQVDLPSALKDCQKAVDLDGGAAPFHDSLAWTYLRMGDPAKAKAAFDRAIAIEVRAFSLFGRGVASLRLGDATGAERDLAEARRLDRQVDDDVRKQGFEVVDSPAPPATGVRP